MLPNDRPSLVRSVLHLWHRSGLKKKLTCIVYAVLWMDYSTPVVVRCCICDVLYACRSAWAMAWKSLKSQCPISDPKTAHSGVVGTFYRTPGFPGGVKSFLVVIDSPHSHFRRRFGWDFRADRWLSQRLTFHHTRRWRLHQENKREAAKIIIQAGHVKMWRCILQRLWRLMDRGCSRDLLLAMILPVIWLWELIFLYI